MLISNEGNIKREELKEDIIKLVLVKEQLSIKEIARLYNETQYISKRLIKEIIKELIAQGILVKVEDLDHFGNNVDDVVLNENYELEGR